MIVGIVAYTMPTINITAATKPYTQFSSCDTNWTHYELETTNFKEGNGAVGITLAPNQIRPLQTGNGADRFLQITSTNIDLSDATGGVGMWVWSQSDTVFDIGDIQLTSSENSDVNAYVWNINQWKERLTPGWTWLTLKFSDALKLGSPNPNALNFMRFFATHKSLTSKRFLLDDIRLIDVTNSSNINAPAYIVTPPVNTNPTKSYTGFSGCNTNWTHYELETINFKEGNGAVGISLAPNQIRPVQTGNGTDRYMQITSENINLSESTGGIGMWVWSAGNIVFDIGDIQLTSSATSDVNAYVWNIIQWKERLNPGWTWLTLKFSDAQKLGSPNPNALNFMRFFVSHKSLTSKKFLLDDIRLIDITNNSNFNAPVYTVSNTSSAATSSSSITSSSSTVTSVTTNNSNLPDYYKLLNCDSDWGRYTYDTEDKKEGNGSISQSILGNMCYFEAGYSSTDSQDKQKALTPLNVKYSFSSCYIGLWIYFDGKAFINNGVGIIEIGSAGKYDTDSYQFPRQLWESQIDTKKPAWNWVLLKLSEANVIGTPKLSAVNYFRLYFSKTNDEQLSIKLDDIRIINGEKPDNLKTPTYSSNNKKFEGSGEYYTQNESSNEQSSLTPINDLVLNSIVPYEGYTLSGYNSFSILSIVFGGLSVIIIFVATTLLILYLRKRQKDNKGSII